ncbi:hypothetical protein HQQ81_13050 [Microbacteriaceae bacterium VKM Ac-2854]|nr:hypothetical protein [Microbacteriaceae bacterium VKM Ac-2854]
MTRPSLDARLTEEEFRRWYWLRAELAVFARERGVAASGSKQDLADRIAASLAGRPQPLITRLRVTAQLQGPLTDDTPIPPGQRSNQRLRAWFVERIGAGFRFDATMRAYLLDGGHTLGEAVEHWHATRDPGPKPIAEQFELNRFARHWHAEHPHGDRENMLAAWRRHRALPRDARAAG